MPREVIAAKIAEVEATDPPVMCNDCLAAAGPYEETMEAKAAALEDEVARLERALEIERAAGVVEGRAGLAGDVSHIFRTVTPGHKAWNDVCRLTDAALAAADAGEEE